MSDYQIDYDGIVSHILDRAHKDPEVIDRNDIIDFAGFYVAEQMMEEIIDRVMKDPKCQPAIVENTFGYDVNSEAPKL